MLMIRLRRVGRKNDPAFRIVLCEKRSKPQTNGIELLGSYYPKTKNLLVRQDRIVYWGTHGAKMSPTVRQLLKRHSQNRPQKEEDGVDRQIAPAAIVPAEEPVQNLTA